MGEMADLFNEQQYCVEEEQYMNDLMNSKAHYEYFNKQTDMKIGDKGVATVTAIQPSGTWKTNQGDLMYQQEVTLKSPSGNEHTFQANSKSEEPPYKIGDLVKYEIKREYQGTFTAGIKKDDGYPSQSSGGRKYPTEKDKYPSFALAYANQLVYSSYTMEGHNTVQEIGEKVTALADIYLQWLNENSK